MKPTELESLAAGLSGDVRAVTPHLTALDKHLILRTYAQGYTLSPIDTQLWLAIRNNKAVVGFVRRGSFAHVLRWFLFVEATHPEIQDDVKKADAAAKARIAGLSKAGASYDLALQNTEEGV